MYHAPKRRKLSRVDRARRAGHRKRMQSLYARLVDSDFLTYGFLKESRIVLDDGTKIPDESGETIYAEDFIDNIDEVLR